MKIVTSLGLSSLLAGIGLFAAPKIGIPYAYSNAFAGALSVGSRLLTQIAGGNQEEIEDIGHYFGSASMMGLGICLRSGLEISEDNAILLSGISIYLACRAIEATSNYLRPQLNRR